MGSKGTRKKDKVIHHVLYLRESEAERWPRQRIEQLIRTMDDSGFRPDFMNFDKLVVDIQKLKIKTNIGWTKEGCK